MITLRQSSSGYADTIGIKAVSVSFRIHKIFILHSTPDTRLIHQLHQIAYFSVIRMQHSFIVNFKVRQIFRCIITIAIEADKIRMAGSHAFKIAFLCTYLNVI